MRRVYIVVAVAALVAFGACGKKDDAPVTPPPPPTSPNPPTNPLPPPTPTAGGCAIPQAGPSVSQTGSPFYGSLRQQYGGGFPTSSSAITLGIHFQGTNGNPYYNYNSNIMAGGLISLTELSGYALPYQGAPQPTTQSCISSSVNNPGFIQMMGPEARIQIVLSGSISLPYAMQPVPMGGFYPPQTQPQFNSTPQPMTVAVGYSCPASLMMYQNSTRIQGCVDVQIGNGQFGQPIYLRYQAQ